MRRLLFRGPSGSKPWTDDVQPGEFLVFRVDIRTGDLLDQDGVLAFGSLAQARAYSADQVTRQVGLVYEIYDFRGRSGDAVAKYYSNPDIASRLRSARVKLWAGVALLPIAALFIAVDVQHDLLLIWGCMIGLKLVLVGAVLIAHGWIALRAARPASSRQIH